MNETKALRGYSGIGGLGYHGMDGMLYEKIVSRKKLRSQGQKLRRRPDAPPKAPREHLGRLGPGGPWKVTRAGLFPFQDSAWQSRFLNPPILPSLDNAASLTRNRSLAVHPISLPQRSVCSQLTQPWTMRRRRMLRSLRTR
jgi:hypothetical protein